jgi:cytochrome bd-type quinol oxidase subunit 2
VTSPPAAHLNACILSARALSTRFQMRSEAKHRTRAYAFAAIAVLCVMLLGLLAVAQVAHTHQGVSDADHCPLCIVMHSAVPMLTGAGLIALVWIAMTAAVQDAHVPSRNWHAQLFIRPPPPAS